MNNKTLNILIGIVTTILFIELFILLMISNGWYRSPLCNEIQLLLNPTPTLAIGQS